jgi:single-stranded DNA-binding protein
MTEAAVSFAGNLTDDPELRHTEAGIARAMFLVAVSGRRDQEASFFTVVVWLWPRQLGDECGDCRGV